MSSLCEKFIAVVPAAGVGKRMQMKNPKQYLVIEQQTILEHTVLKLLSHPLITHVVIAISEDDEYFQDTALSTHQNISVVNGGEERVDSVLAGLLSINTDEFPWVLVHDAARPCVSLGDISALIEQTQSKCCGGLLAYPVRDTMKKARAVKSRPVSSVLIKRDMVETTVEREDLWHALTPQLYKTNELISAIYKALEDNMAITDESSAIEYAGFGSLLVEGNSNNIKITRPDDLLLANFILSQQNAEHTTSTNQSISNKVK